MRTKTIQVKYVFTDTEMKGMQAQLSTDTILLRDKEEEKKSVGKQYAAEISSYQASTNLLAIKIQAGHEPRMVKCELVPDHENVMISYVREDTGETINRRKMTPEERQADAFDK